MDQKAKDYIYQYKILFCLSWIFLYLIFPSWISLHSIFRTSGVSDFSYPIARSIAIFGLVIYFSLSAYLMNRCFDAILIDKPLFSRIKNWSEHIKSNIWFAIICFLSVVLHIYSFSLIQVSYLSQGLWMYDFSNKYWNGLFNIPIQYFFWALIILLIVITRQNKLFSGIVNYIGAQYPILKSSNTAKFLAVFSLYSFLVLYSYLFPYYSWQDSMVLLRYPPVSHYLYLMTYYAFGVSHIGPRVVQLIFYVLGAVYLYRTIYLFCAKETALLGATIYLFSPIIFYYASASALASGTVFFIIIISYYFLRFIKGQDYRDLILATFFIGTGFLYKRVILVMFAVCFTYLILSKIKKRDWRSIKDFKILLLSLIPIMPWLLKIGSSSVYYEITWSQLLSFDRLIAYALTIHAQLSSFIFVLLLFSLVFVLFRKRDDLSLFFGLLFIAYYSFFTLGQTLVLHRYSMALYPAISVLLAQLVYSICARIRWKYVFKLIFSVLTIYLIIICLIPRSSSNITTFRYKDLETQYNPIDEATDWVKNRTGIDEKILVPNMRGYYKFYVENIYTDKDRINLKRFAYFKLKKIWTMTGIQKFQEFCEKNGISYIMYQYSPRNDFSDFPYADKLELIKENLDNAFTETAKFNVDDNYIFIYKVE